MLIGTAVFLSLVVVLLALPVTLTYRLAWKETLSANLRLSWAFGLVRADVSPDKAETGSGEPHAVRSKAGRRGKSKGGKKNVMAAIRRPSFRRRVLRFVADLWRAIHKQDVRLRVRLGLGDPADTGRLWAVLGPVSGLAAGFREISVAIEPEFYDATLEVDSSGTIRVFPLQVVIIVLALLVSPPVWRGVLAMRATG